MFSSFQPYNCVINLLDHKWLPCCKNLWTQYNLLFFPFMDLTFDVKSKNYLPIARLKCFFPTWILNKLFCRSVGHFESVFMVWVVWFRSQSHLLYGFLRGGNSLLQHPLLKRLSILLWRHFSFGRKFIGHISVFISPSFICVCTTLSSFAQQQQKREALHYCSL